MSDGHHTATLNDYTITIHPAFASRCEVHGEGGEKHEIYRQKDVHVFKNGEKHPHKHEIRLKGGKYGRDIALEVSDPHSAIARITVELYGEGHVPGAPSTAATAETLVVYNTGLTCPPHCKGDSTGGGTTIG